MVMRANDMMKKAAEKEIQIPNIIILGPLQTYVRPVRRIGTEIRSGPVRSSVSDRSRPDLGPDRSDEKFSDGAKISKKKFGATRSISSKNRRNRSHPRDF